MKNRIIQSIAFLLIFISLASCSNNDVQDVVDQINEDEYLWYFSGKLNGESFIYGQKANETTVTYELSYSNTLPSTCLYSSDNGFTYNTGIYPSFDDTLPTMDIEFIRMHVCSDGEQNEVFNEAFNEGAYSFAENNQDIQANARKIGIYYSSSANASSSYNTYQGNQAESTFKITSSLPYVDYYLSRELIGEFSATLYNENDPSDSIVITDGRFKIIVTE